MEKKVTRSLVTEIVSILYLIAFTQLNGWVRWIAFAMFLENLLESMVLSITSKGKS